MYELSGHDNPCRFDLPTPDIDEARRALGSVFWKRREAAGLTRGVLGAQLGGRKAPQRLAQWEKGERPIPQESQEKLASLLQIPDSALRSAQSALEEATAKAGLLRRAAVDAWSRAVGAEHRLLALHYDRLQTARTQILERASWRDVQSMGAHVAVMAGPFGVNSGLTLGRLLGLWEGILRFTCPECGADALGTRGWGSRLSGSMAVFGVCSKEGGCVRGRALKGLPKVRDIALALRVAVQKTPCDGLSRWSLGQLLSGLGVDVADIQVWSPHAGQALVYRHREADLRTQDGALVEQFDFDGEPECKHPFDDATAPSPYTLRVLDTDRDPWTYAQGGLFRPDRTVAALLDGSLPPPVVRALVRIGAIRTVSRGSWRMRSEPVGCSCLQPSRTARRTMTNATTTRCTADLRTPRVHQRGRLRLVGGVLRPQSSRSRRFVSNLWSLRRTSCSRLVSTADRQSVPPDAAPGQR